MKKNQTSELCDVPPAGVHLDTDTTCESRKGTREWSDVSFNIYNGCSHQCRYCYAQAIALRFKRKTAANWHLMERNTTRISETREKRLEKSVMFPTTHDITPETLDESLKALDFLVKRYQKVLIVSKPHLECIDAMTSRYTDYREIIEFRFTIGSIDDGILKYWEPGAPGFSERLNSLMLASERGFKTSVSCEPMLDLHIDRVIAAVDPYVSETIWIGTPNRLWSVLPVNGYRRGSVIHAEGKKLEGLFTPEVILNLYDRFHQHPKVRWKDSIRDSLGLAAYKDIA